MTFTTVKLDKARNIVLGFKAMQEFYRKKSYKDKF